MKEKDPENRVSLSTATRFFSMSRAPYHTIKFLFLGKDDQSVRLVQGLGEAARGLAAFNGRVIKGDKSTSRPAAGR